ncbi:MAG: sulfate adenylyltransferase subunit 1 [Bryobacteraceae bacterium]
MHTMVEKPLLRISTAGSVDDGKSTLIGRLLYDSKSVWEDHLEEVSRNGVNRAARGPDLSLLTDGLRAEREQGITIDVAYRYFATPRRKFIVADTPGHEQYTRNMATGASTAEVALLLVDARKGVLPQTVRHATIAWLLGIRKLAFVINKMDLEGFRREVFENVQTQARALLGSLPGADAAFFPISALDGDNVVTVSLRTRWYDGPSLLDWLENVDVPPAAEAPFRLPVQLVIRPHLDFRGYAGQVASGCVRPGDGVRIEPSGTEARVKRIVSFDGDLDEASAGMSVTLELDREVDVSRGDWISSTSERPARAQRLRATVVWMSDQPGRSGASYLLQHGTRVTPVRLSRVSERLDVVRQSNDAASELQLNDIGNAELETAEPLAFDRYTDNRATGGFILIDRLSNLTVAAGLIRSALGDEIEAHPLSAAERAELFGHKACLIDLSARPELAPALERQLLLRHFHAVTVGNAGIDEQFLLQAGLLVLSTTYRPGAALDARGLASDAPRAVAALVEQLRQARVLGAGNFIQGDGI